MEIETVRLHTGDGSIALAVDISGPQDGRPIVLLHGGGQTRHSWRKALRAFAEAGYRAVAFDARGHGDSDWDPQADYSAPRLAADLRAVLAHLPPSPVLVGASMGGVTALYATAEAEQPIARGLVLVDITPRVDRQGSQRITDFMLANPDGFATLEQAADAVAAHNPNRPRPKDPSGLSRSLRERNGRLFWHWDPQVAIRSDDFTCIFDGALDRSAAKIAIPTLLMRGLESDLVREPEVAHFRELMPHAEYVDIKGAGHMIVGDKNDIFNEAVLSFVDRIDSPAL